MEITDRAVTIDYIGNQVQLITLIINRGIHFLKYLFIMYIILFFISFAIYNLFHRFYLPSDQ